MMRATGWYRRLLMTGMAVMPVLTGCASTGGGDSQVYAATVIEQIDPEEPREAATREALIRAEAAAREQIRERIYQTKLDDSRSLDDLAAVDPFVRAVVDDTLRMAVIDDRTVAPDGTVTVTLEVDLKPINRLVEEYPRHAIR